MAGIGFLRVKGINGGFMENEKVVVLQIKLSRKNCLLALTIALLCFHPRLVGSETLTLTTYYPAPYGGYASILSTGQTLLARDNGAVGIGTDTTGSAKLSVMNGTVGIGTTDPQANLHIIESTTGDPDIKIGKDNGNWIDMGWNRANAAGMISTTNGASITMRGGNVGIGTANPTAKLEVVGGTIKASGGLVLPPGAPATPMPGDIWVQ